MLMIDGRMESDRFGPGSGVFTYYRMLRKIGETFPDFSVLNDRFSLGSESERAWTPALRLVRAAVGGVQHVKPSSTSRDLYRQAHVRFRMTGRLTRLVIDGPPGIMHWTYPVPLWVEGWRNLYTVHDALQLGPGGLQGAARARHIALLNAVRARADTIVTVSDFSRNELVRHLGWQPDTIVNASIAVPDPLVAPQQGLRREGPIVVLGTNGPRKNIGFLLEAYIRSGITRPMVIAGPVNDYVKSLIAAFGTLPGVRFLGTLSDLEISALLGTARCLAFPSLAEGFGLPIVEAMMHGCPVICARAGAMHEVAGGAALGFALHDMAELTAHLRAIDTDDSLAETLRAAGEIRAQAFSENQLRRRLSRLYGT